MFFCKEQAGVWIKSHPRPCAVCWPHPRLSFLCQLCNRLDIFERLSIFISTQLPMINGMAGGGKGNLEKTEGQVRL